MFLVNDQMVNILDFAGHITFKQLLNSTVVFQKQPLGEQRMGRALLQEIL